MTGERVFLTLLLGDRAECSLPCCVVKECSLHICLCVGVPVLYSLRKVFLNIARGKFFYTSAQGKWSWLVPKKTNGRGWSHLFTCFSPAAFYPPDTLIKNLSGIDLRWVFCPPCGIYLPQLGLTHSCMCASCLCTCFAMTSQNWFCV